MKKILQSLKLRGKYCFLATLLLLHLIIPAWGNNSKAINNENNALSSHQARQVNGRVISEEDGQGLPGVNVVEKGTTNGTVTNSDGVYSLNVNVGAILVFSSVGFASEEIEVGNQSVIDLTLKPDVKQLEELVVVGYGTERKVNVIGSVS